MHSFHFFVYLLGIRSIKDTQCGFKLLTRKSCQQIIPYMHVEGWIFDIELLLLAFRRNIPVAEVAVNWHEVEGTKLSIVFDSLQMLTHLIIIRLNYFLGIWSESTIVQE